MDRRLDSSLNISRGRKHLFFLQKNPGNITEINNLQFLLIFCSPIE